MPFERPHHQRIARVLASLDGALLAEIRADQYGIRTRVAVDSHRVKLEIVYEARIALEPPGKGDEICGLPTLTPRDMASVRPLPRAGYVAPGAARNGVAPHAVAGAAASPARTTQDQGGSLSDSAT